jgi:hypothetical protein
VSPEEYTLFLDLIMSTKLMKDVGGQALIRELLFDQIGVNEDKKLEAGELSKIQCLFVATDTHSNLTVSFIPSIILYYPC